MLKDKERLNSASYTPEEKSQMMDILVQHGCTRGTAYNRLFRDGFVRWQLVGIGELCRIYIREKGLDIGEPTGSSFYLFKIPSREDFKTFMEQYGMGRVTTMRRFTEWDFEQWELCGVYNLLPEVCQSPRT